MKRVFYTILTGISVAFTIFCIICLLSGCSTKLGGSYTRIYPVYDYVIQTDGVHAYYTLENYITGDSFFKNSKVYLHDSEDTIIVISSNENGRGFAGLKECYLYLNENNYLEQIEQNKGGS